MKQFLSSNIRWLLPTGAVLAAGVAYLAFAVFGIHLLFIDDEVNEALPVFGSDAVATSDEQSATKDEPSVTEDEATATNDEQSPTEEPADEDTAVEPLDISVEYSGNFGDRSHPTSGVAQVLGDGSGQRFLRFENFETDNGPDLDIYLSAAPPDAPAGDFDADFVDLGDLKGNIGPQNYEIPVGVDLDRYRTVVIWCVRFRVAFGTAGLAAV